ncbi:hypothetical protein VF13_36925, partial [Nostoc linckia z16]
MATFTVNTINDDNDTSNNADSLREAIIAANNTVGDDIIIFDVAANSTFRLTSALPTITSNISIQGTSGSNLTISGDANNNGINDAGDVSLFSVNQGIVSIANLTLANGRAQGSNGVNGAGGNGGFGGALFINNGTVTISSVNFINNQAIGGNGGTGNTGANGGGGGDGGFFGSDDGGSNGSTGGNGNPGSNGGTGGFGIGGIGGGGGAGGGGGRGGVSD